MIFLESDLSWVLSPCRNIYLKQLLLWGPLTKMHIKKVQRGGWFFQNILDYLRCVQLTKPSSSLLNVLNKTSVQIFLEINVEDGLVHHTIPTQCCLSGLLQHFGTSSRVSDLEQVAIILIIHLSFFFFSLSFFPAFYFSTRRVGARALKFSM